MGSKGLAKQTKRERTTNISIVILTSGITKLKSRMALNVNMKLLGKGEGVNNNNGKAPTMKQNST